MMTFSFRPSSWSRLPLIAASVSTLVVSWKEAADNQESVAKDALVIPMSSGRPAAGVPPSATVRRFSSSKRTRSHNSPGRSEERRVGQRGGCGVGEDGNDEREQ